MVLSGGGGGDWSGLKRTDSAGEEETLGILWMDLIKR